MLLPTVAIVGRPNVGKSSLFNRLVGKPISIVDPTAGVTRDRILHQVERDGARFDLIDTGGIGVVDEAKLEADVEAQVRRAVDTADVIVFLCDGRDGVTGLDREIATQLRPHAGKLLLVVNKIDHDALEAAVGEFHALGLGEPLAVSAEQVLGLSTLVEAIAARLPPPGELAAADSAAAAEGRIKICLAGRRNVGKSSLTNALLGEPRMIVADYAGTTREAVDVKLDCPAGKFVLIDTAGLRKKKQLAADLEFYAATRTERAIRRADVVFLVLDASDEVGVVDKKLAHFCEVEGKPTVLVVNKWDIAEEGGATRDQYETWLRDRLPGLRFAPIVYVSALRGTHLGALLPMATELHAESNGRISTAELNKLLHAAVQRRRPRVVGGGKAVKLYYATQAETSPPTFIVFCNTVEAIEPGYSRYLSNYIRERVSFSRVPIHIIFKERATTDEHGEAVEQKRTLARTKADRNAGLILPIAARLARSGASKRRPRRK